MTGPEVPGAFFAGAERIGRWLENLLLSIILSSLIGLAAWQVFLRTVVGTGIAWGDEALRLLVLWAAMAGAVAASRDDAHLRIDLVSRYLPPRGRLATALLVDAFTAAITGVLAWYAYAFVAESREFGDLLLGTLPAWWFQLIMPVAFALICYRYVVWVLRRLYALLLPAKPT